MSENGPTDAEAAPPEPPQAAPSAPEPPEVVALDWERVALTRPRSGKEFHT